MNKTYTAHMVFLRSMQTNKTSILLRVRCVGNEVLILSLESL